MVTVVAGVNEGSTVIVVIFRIDKKLSYCHIMVKENMSSPLKIGKKIQKM